jgi:uncharacterized OsmC-like protein
MHARLRSLAAGASGSVPDFAARLQAQIAPFVMVTVYACMRLSPAEKLAPASVSRPAGLLTLKASKTSRHRSEAMFNASIENRGGTQSFAKTSAYEFVIDTEGKGAHPIETLMAALAGCISHQLQTYFREHRIQAAGFRVHTASELTADKTRLSDIRIRVCLKDTAAEPENEAGVLECVQSCKIYSTLSRNSKMSVVLEGRAWMAAAGRA